jgi:hypothetical protein
VLTGVLPTAYFIAFGPHGPRRPPPPDEGRKVLFLSSAVIAGAFALFAFTRMFASPIRPRTMTKEWQEATEEYMKVRNFVTAGAAYLTTTHKLTHLAVPGNRAHHRIQGHDGPVGFGEEPPSRREAQRRVNERLKASETHNTNTNTNITFPWVNIPFGTTCVRYTTRSKGLRASAGLAHVILVPPCTEILEAFAIFTLPSPLRTCV